MSETYIKDKMLKNGHRQMSVYDKKSDALLSTYEVAPNGKKDGELIEYFKDSQKIKRKESRARQAYRTVYENNCLG